MGYARIDKASGKVIAWLGQEDQDTIAVPEAIWNRRTKALWRYADGVFEELRDYVAELREHHRLALLREMERRRTAPVELGGHRYEGDFLWAEKGAPLRKDGVLCVVAPEETQAVQKAFADRWARLAAEFADLESRLSACSTAQEIGGVRWTA